MTKRQWLALTPIVVLLGLGLSQSVVAAPQVIPDETCANCMTLADNNSSAAPDDFSNPDSNDVNNNNDDDDDSSQYFDQGQSEGQPQNALPDADSAPQAPVQTPVVHAPTQNMIGNGNPN